MYSFVFTYLSTRGFGEGEWATPHCKRQNVPSSQLTTKFARDEADKVKETSSSDKTGTTLLGRKHRARILPLSVTGHTRNRVPETRDENVKTTVDCKAACIFACRSRTREWSNKRPDTRVKMECETGERFFQTLRVTHTRFAPKNRSWENKTVYFAV